jgi:hypothetical protein
MTGVKDRDQELAEQLPENWDEKNEIPDRAVEEAAEEKEEDHDEETLEDKVKEKLDPEDIMVTRGKDGEVEPIEVPIIMHPHKEGTVEIRPLTGRDEKSFSMMQVDYKEKLESGVYEQRGDYDFDQNGKHVGYGGISLNQIRHLINKHLVEPELPEFETIGEMLDTLRESMMMSLFYTIKIYGLGMELDKDDDMIERLSDKKK